MERAGALYLELNPNDERERLYREYGNALRRRVPADAAGRGEPAQMLRQHFSVLAVRCGQVVNLLAHVGQYLDFWNHLSLGHWACYVRRNMRAAWRP